MKGDDDKMREVDLVEEWCHIWWGHVVGRMVGGEPGRGGLYYSFLTCISLFSFLSIVIPDTLWGHARGGGGILEYQTAFSSLFFCIFGAF